MKLTKLLMTLGFVTALSLNSQAAISIVGATGPITFDSLPPVTEWSTVSIAGGGGDINDAAALDAGVAALTAAGVSTVLPQSPTVPPSNNANARHNTTALYLQTRPTGNRAAVLMATLQNDSGNPITALTIEYDLGVNNEIAEQIAGHRIYFSLTGDANSWMVAGELATAGPASISANLNSTPWAAGAPLYLLWVDDNANPGTDGSYTIDNVVFTPSFGSDPPSVEISSPIESQMVVQSTLLTLSARTRGPILSVDFYVDDALYFSDTAAPFSTTTNTTPMAPGPHKVYARATDSSAGTHTSPTINFTITPNTPPTLSITNVYGTNLTYGTVTGLTHLVGTAVHIQAGATDDVAITNIDWFVDGVFHVNRPATAPNWIYHNALAGSRVIHGIATDRGGLMTTTPNTTLTITNPPAAIFTILVANGETWNYYGSTEQPPDDGGGQPWFAIGYDDSAWLSGPAEIGGGDRGDGYPEATTIDIGPAADRFDTVYFRKFVDIPDPTIFQNIALSVLRDDGVVVYLNGAPIYTNNMPADTVIGYATLAPGAAADEGLAYQHINLDPSTIPLQFGLNVVAVEVHQSSQTSSDLSFDLMLWGETAGAPTIQITSPVNGQMFFTGNDVTVNVAASTFVTNAIVSLDGTPRGSDDTPGLNNTYQVVVTAIGPAGTRTLVASGRDRLTGQLAVSAPVTVTVVDGPVTETLIATGSVWRFLDDGVEAPADWKTLGFDDTLWRSGPAELGHGDNDEATVVTGTNNGINNITVYFRRKFSASNPGDITNLVVNLRRDDGGIVYINDTEVFRSNMPNGPVNHGTFSTAGTTSETAFFSTNVNPSVLIDGQNIIAVEVHQSSDTSSDISFELSLVSTRPPGPGRPRLAIRLTGPTTAELSWSPATPGFRLESSGTVTGGWGTHGSQANPQTINTTGLPRFFRLVNP